MADASKLLRAYLIVGTDELKRKEALGRLKNYVDSGLAAFNLDERVASASMDAQEIISSLSQFAMGAPIRLVIIEQADKLPKAVSESIINYLENPNPTCTLTLVADSLAKTTRLYKAVAKQGEKAVISCEPLNRRELPGHVVKIASKRGGNITMDAAEELVSRVGESTTMLETQIRTLIALSNGIPITRDFVEAHVTRTAEVKPWDFLDAYANRDARRAMKLYNIMSVDSELGLLSLVEVRLREIQCARSLSARGCQDRLAEALADYDNIPVKHDSSKKARRPKQAWQLRNHMRWANKWSDADIAHALASCAECERLLKSSSNKDGVFVDFLIKSC